VFALEVVPVPVSDIDRALIFYTKQVGFLLDVDYQPTPHFRVVQLTPPGSACSLHLVRAANDDRLRELYLVTEDLEAVREQLMASGVQVSDILHKDPVENWAGGWSNGVDSQHRNYCSFADFADPDGNIWTLQERGYHQR